MTRLRYSEGIRQRELSARRHEAVTTYKAARASSAWCDACGWVPPAALRAPIALLHAHHVVPMHAGGDVGPVNLMLLCPTCHALVHHVFQVRKHRKTGAVSWNGPTTAGETAARLRALAVPA